MRSLFTERFRSIFPFFAIVFLLWASSGNGFAQSAQEGKALSLHMGEVTFRTREIELKPESMRLLELHVPVFNRSRKETAPANTITVVATVKEVESLENRPVTDYDPGTVETTINIPLSPGAGQVVVLGIPLPREKIASITFEITISPPDGERKRVIWTGQ